MCDLLQKYLSWGVKRRKVKNSLRIIEKVLTKRRF